MFRNGRILARNTYSLRKQTYVTQSLSCTKLFHYSRSASVNQLSLCESRKGSLLHQTTQLANNYEECGLLKSIPSSEAEVCSQTRADVQQCGGQVARGEQCETLKPSLIPNDAWSRRVDQIGDSAKKLSHISSDERNKRQWSSMYQLATSSGMLSSRVMTDGAANTLQTGSTISGQSSSSLRHWTDPSFLHVNPTHLQQRRHISFGPKGIKEWEMLKFDPKKGRLVYCGGLTKMVSLVKAFSVSSSIIGLCLQPYLYSISASEPLVVKVIFGAFVSIFIFLTPLMLHYITKRYVTKMYYDADKELFTSTTLSLFVREKDLVFSARDVALPAIPGLFLTVRIKGKPMFMNAESFLNREAYMKMMRYDEPMDWGITDDTKKESS